MIGRINSQPLSFGVRRPCVAVPSIVVARIPTTIAADATDNIVQVKRPATSIVWRKLSGLGRRLPRVLPAASRHRTRRQDPWRRGPAARRSCCRSDRPGSSPHVQSRQAFADGPHHARARRPRHGCSSCGRRCAAASGRQQSKPSIKSGYSIRILSNYNRSPTTLRRST